MQDKDSFIEEIKLLQFLPCSPKQEISFWPSVVLMGVFFQGWHNFSRLQNSVPLMEGEISVSISSCAQPLPRTAQSAVTIPAARRDKSSCSSLRTLPCTQDAEVPPHPNSLRSKHFATVLVSK